MTAVAEQACAPRITSGHAGEEPYASWVRRARCAGQATVFGDDSRADEAAAMCGRCPVLRQCRAWALRNAVDGVAGSMTADERAAWRKTNAVAEPTLTAEDFVPAEVVSAGTKWGRGRSDSILRAVEQWTANGGSGRQIATRLGVTRRDCEQTPRHLPRAPGVVIAPTSCWQSAGNEGQGTRAAPWTWPLTPYAFGSEALAVEVRFEHVQIDVTPPQRTALDGL